MGWDCQSNLVEKGNQCGGNGFCANSNCKGGLNCYRKNENISTCERSCPPDWECNDANLVQEYGQCGGLLLEKCLKYFRFNMSFFKKDLALLVQINVVVDYFALKKIFIFHNVILIFKYY